MHGDRLSPEESQLAEAADPAARAIDGNPVSPVNGLRGALMHGGVALRACVGEEGIFGVGGGFEDRGRKIPVFDV